MKNNILKLFVAAILFITVFMGLKETAEAGGGIKAYAILKDDTLTFYYNTYMVDTADGATKVYENIPTDSGQTISWVVDEYGENAKKVIIDESFKDFTELKSTANWFFELKNIESFEGLENLNTSNVTDMHQMFDGCDALKTISFGGAFDTSNVKDMRSMFCNCNNLTSIDVSGFNTSNVENMDMMFSKTNVSCLDLSGFDTSNVNTMRSMFYDCKSLSSIEFGDKFNTGNVNNMSSMFTNCTSLGQIDVSNFDTSNVNNMSSMFAACSSLEKLDLSSFSNATSPSLTWMFINCSSLKTVYVGKGWDSSKCNGNNVFTGCISIDGGNGTVYDSTKVDYTYARIDGGVYNPGYFFNTKDPGNVQIETSGDVSSDAVIKNIEETVGMTQEEIAEMNSGSEFATVLEVNETTPDEDTNNKVNELLAEEEVKKVCTLDISLFLKNLTNNTNRPITETTQNVEIKINLPAELIPSQSEEVGVIRIHNGVSEVLPSKYDAASGKIIFNTNEFSIYVIYLKAGSNNGGNDSFNYLDPLRSTLKTLIAYNATDTVVVWEEGTALPYDVMQLIKESNVTVEFKYTFEGVDYDVLINKSNVPSEYVEWYGPLYLAGLSKNYSNAGLTVHGEYVVKPDDTMNLIATKFNTTVDELMRLNPFIKDSHWIYPGQVIKY